MELTIAYITAREKPCIEWMLDSLRLQTGPDDKLSIIVVDALKDSRPINLPESVLHVSPKPTIWQGKHRVTKEDWWAAANARNTAICLCRTEWIAFLDDRCVLLSGWLDGIRKAIKHGYSVCGSYEKRTGMRVEGGIISHGGIVTGEDGRCQTYNKEMGAHVMDGPAMCPGEWMFGCSFALPLGWALNINGQDETCDGVSMEDCIFGLQLKNNGYPLCFDPSMKIVEDRTTEDLGSKMRREDKGVSPNDKSHAMLAMLRDSKRAMHHWDLKAIRETVLAGGEFPVPEKKQYRDWFDGEVIDENYMSKKEASCLQTA